MCIPKPCRDHKKTIPAVERAPATICWKSVTPAEVTLRKLMSQRWQSPKTRPETTGWKDSTWDRLVWALGFFSRGGLVLHALWISVRNIKTEGLWPARCSWCYQMAETFKKFTSDFLASNISLHGKWSSSGMVAHGSTFYLQYAFAAASHLAHGGFYVGEHPALPRDADRPSIWSSPVIELLRQHPDAHLHQDQFRYGARASPQGYWRSTCLILGGRCGKEPIGAYLDLLHRPSASMTKATFGLHALTNIHPSFPLPLHAALPFNWSMRLIRNWSVLSLLTFKIGNRSTTCTV